MDDGRYEGREEELNNHQEEQEEEYGTQNEEEGEEGEGEGEEGGEEGEGEENDLECYIRNVNIDKIRIRARTAPLRPMEHTE